MATLERARPTIDRLHSRTATLAYDAEAAGDDFLKYLYLMALKHIEEKAAVERSTRA